MAGSTPIYGFPYPQSTDLVADYPTLGQELATDVETVISGLGSGLNLITPTSIANSGGTASASGGAVTFSGVTSLSLNGVFTSVYDNYRIMAKVTGSVGATLYYRMRLSGTDNSASTYYSQIIQGNGTSVSASRQSNAAAFGCMSELDTGLGSLGMDLMSPALAEYTTGFGMDHRPTSGTIAECRSHSHATATAFDGLTIYPQSGNMTGKIRIYGYKN